MARNTHITGLGAGNKLMLERWGKTAAVFLEDASMHRVRVALYDELPVKPTQLKKEPEAVTYDQSTGQTRVTLSPEGSELLRAVVLHVVQATGLVPDTQEEADLLNQWDVGLERAIDAHQEYLDLTKEPGVDPSVDDTKQTC